MFCKFLITWLSLWALARPRCELLSSGTYRIIQIIKSPGKRHDVGSESRIVIDGINFCQYWNNGDSAKGSIEWIHKCIFKLGYDRYPNPLGKLLINSFGDVCFEVKEQHGDTTNFRSTYSGNLEITTGEGMIIKMQPAISSDSSHKTATSLKHFLPEFLTSRPFTTGAAGRK
jgi:hypothetical protein